MTGPDRHLSRVRNGLLSALPPGDLARLLPGLEPVELHADQTLFPAYSAVEAVFFVESGMVSLIAGLKDGERVEVGITGREGLVGLPLVFGKRHSLVEARVQMGGAALRMGAAAFRAGMEASPALRELLLDYALACMAHVTQTVECNTFHPIERRLARWLLMAHDRAGADAFPMKHEFLSIMLGVRRTGVTAAAGVLQKAGLIHYARGRMAIRDRLGLEAASCECYHTGKREFARLLGPGAARQPD